VEIPELTHLHTLTLNKNKIVNLDVFRSRKCRAGNDAKHGDFLMLLR